MFAASLETDTVTVDPERHFKLSWTLLGSGSILWAVHSAFILTGLVIIILSGAGSDPLRYEGLISGILGVGLIAVAAGSFLIFYGLTTVPRGCAQFNAFRSGSVGLIVMSPSTVRQARLAAPFFLLYSLLASVAAATLVFSSAVADYALFSAWLLAAILLVVGGVFLVAFAKGNRVESNGIFELRGDWIAEYAVLNLIGVVLVVASLASESLAALIVLSTLGGMIALIAVPISGLAVFVEIGLHLVRQTQRRSIPMTFLAGLPVSPLPATAQSMGGAITIPPSSMMDPSGWVATSQPPPLPPPPDETENETAT